MAPPRGVPLRKISWPPDDELVALYWSMGFRGIAATVGCSHSSVAKRFRRIGVVPRNSQRASEIRMKGMLRKGLL